MRSRRRHPARAAHPPPPAAPYARAARPRRLSTSGRPPL